MAIREELEKLKNRDTKDEKQKARELNRKLREICEKKRTAKVKQKLKESSTKDCIAMFKDYSSYKLQNKTKIPATLSVQESPDKDTKVSKPSETAYAHYMGKVLLAKKLFEKPNISGPVNHERSPVVTEERIKATIKKLNGFKTPGITHIPVAYYQWLVEDMIEPLK